MKFKFCLAALVAGAIAAPLAAQETASKVDKALTQSLQAGCGTEHVIIRTKPGYRAGLALSLQAHGDAVAAEHPGIDAVTAELHCDDLAVLARYPEILSISHDAIVSAAGLGGPVKNNVAAAASSKAKAEKAAAGKVGDGAGVKADKRQALEQRAAIARPLRNAHARRDDDDAASENVRGGETPTTAAETEGKSAENEQGGMFESLGITGRRNPSRTPSSVMLGDVVVAVDETTGNDHDQTRHGYVSEPVGIAIIDSGIAPSWEFGHRITHFYDFTSGRTRKTRPSDPFGHGTHVAGLVGGLFVGVAPEVQLVGLRVLDRVGQGRTSHVIKALEFATANRKQLRIRAINLSLGHPVYEPAASDPLVQAVENAVRAGLVVITSAGNVGINPATGLPGYAGVLSPGNSPSSLTVGALDTTGTRRRGDDRVTPYSSRGPSWYDGFAKPDVVAPGHNILSIAAAGSKLRNEHEKRGGTGNYMRLSGTSMAAGITSGVVALMLQTNPHLTPNALKMLLEFTAIPVNDASGQPMDVLSQGAGAVNASGAIRLGLAIDATRPVGDKWLTAGMPFESTIAGDTLAWSQVIVWGQHRVSGDGLIDENRLAWAHHVTWGEGLGRESDNIVWGTRFDEGDNIVWGTNFVWSDAYQDNIVWGTVVEDDNIVWGTNLVWGNRLIGVSEGDNIVWGTAFDADNIVWGTLTDDNVVWGTFYQDADNIVWGTFRFGDADNLVWGTLRFSEADNIVWGTLRFTEGDNIVWGTLNFGEADNIVWGTLRFAEDDNIVWGTLRFAEDDNIVWGTYRGFGESDNIVWGTGAMLGGVAGRVLTPVPGTR